MKITSLDFKNNEKIPVKFTADGSNINPCIIIQDVPKEAKSLVLIIEDPDAQSGTWTHWTLFNIKPEIYKIEENSVPKEAVQGANSWGNNTYQGPSPPSGTHRYFFKVYALDKALDLRAGAKKQDIEEAMHGHILNRTELIGLYSR